MKKNRAVCVTMMNPKNNDYQKSDPNTIKRMFGLIAKRYDFVNGVLSLNLHKSWNRKLVAHTFSENPSTILDLCAGTGEIAFTWLKKVPSRKKAYLIDFCKEMLDQVKERDPLNHDIEIIVGDAQEIPLSDKSVEAVSVAYGIRNVKDPALCFREVHRVLLPGGTFGILELTEPKNKLLRGLHGFYLSKMLPFFGGLLTANPKAYSYLSNSIQSFSKPAELKDKLEKAGFTDIQIKPMTFGIAHLITAKKKS